MAVKTKRARGGGPQLEPYQVLIRPLITEKGTHMATRAERRAEKPGAKPLGNAYQFEVNSLATKEQIKVAVEELFHVRVEKVRTQNRVGKTRRYRARIGRLPNWKKAIVTLRGEDRLEFF